jgi:signal peptidase I
LDYFLSKEKRANKFVQIREIRVKIIQSNMIRRLFSKTIREAVAMRKHVQRLLNAQRDILSPQAIAAIQIKINELNAAIAEGANTGKIRIKTEELQFAAEKWIKPYPNAAWRENIEVLLVALAVAMAIRTFFVQPFKIPTGSMQPTLFGVTSQNFLGDKNFQMPAGWERVKEWFAGISYVDVVAQADGAIDSISPMTKFLIFNIKQTLWIGGVAHTMWFPPDYGEAPAGVDPLVYRARLERDRIYHKGDQVLKLKVSAGDHLFVDRLTYNFRKPVRGDVIVFETAGIPEDMRERYRIPADEFYIKRLVGLPGEKVQIGNDRHLRINGQRLDASTPHFENVYGFDPNQAPRDSQFSGHVNGTVAQEFNLNSLGGVPFFPDEETVFDVPTNSCLPMGDNTCNSLDSRFWGAIPEDYVIGKSFFVYWPITKRFGLNNQ